MYMGRVRTCTALFDCMYATCENSYMHDLLFRGAVSNHAPLTFRADHALAVVLDGMR